MGGEIDMSDDVLVEVSGVSKKFCINSRRAMWYGVKDIGSSLVLRDRSDHLRRDEFLAVDDVSFTLRRGQSLALIGPNGSGKSTLLKMINGLLKPDKGDIRIRGKVSALIELGVAFDHRLTGRENIHVKAAILGIPRQSIARIVDDVVEYSELGDFIDMPVKNYSSGMKVRLGFSIAIQVRPDVLIIDEVLAVGDAGFRGKCYSTIAEYQQECAIVLVSHNMGVVGRICDRGMLLNKGRLLLDGDDVPQIIQRYFSLFGSSDRKNLSDGARIESIELVSSDGSIVKSLAYGESATIRVKVELMLAERPVINLHFLDIAKNYVFQTNSKIDQWELDELEAGAYVFSCVVNPLLLNPGKYTCVAAIFDPTQKHFRAWVYDDYEFYVTGRFTGVGPYIGRGQWSLSGG
jgi:lipopolysaccharide transport system ATP-binding protein